MKKRVLAVLLIGVMCIGLAACSHRGEVRFGTGNVTGNYYTYGNALAECIKEDNSNMSFDVKTTAGSAANMRLIGKNFLQMALVQSDILDSAWNGTGPFKESGAYQNYKAIGAMYTEACQIVVREDSGIRSVADLQGKTVSVGEEESGVLENANRILLCYGLSADMMQQKYLSFSDSAAAMKQGKIDAFFCMAGTPTTVIDELSKDTNIRILSIDEVMLKKLMDTYPMYTKASIAANTYHNQTKPIITLGVSAVLIVSDKMTDDDVYHMTKSIFAHSDTLSMSTAMSNELNERFATADGVTIPFHAGAKRYYEEMGITGLKGESRK